MNEMWIEMLLMLVWLPVIGLTSSMPWLTRKSESFGVTIPEQAQQDLLIRLLRKQYGLFVLAVGVIEMALLCLFRWQGMDIALWSTWQSALVICYLLIGFFVYLLQHRKLQRLKQSRGWQSTTEERIRIDTRFRSQRLILSYYWFLPHLLLTVLNGVVLWINYDRFPNLLPMKYDSFGEIVSSVEKSHLTVMWPVAFQVFMVLMFVAINYVIGTSKQVMEATDSAASLERNRIFRRRWSMFSVLSGFLMVIFFGTIGWGPLFPGNGMLLTIGSTTAPLLIICGAMWLSISLGQGGRRIRLSKQENNNAATLPVHDQDKYWKLGQFYFNQSDPAVFVEKRFGIGWTVNWARPSGWLLLTGIIVVPLLLISFIN